MSYEEQLQACLVWKERGEGDLIALYSFLKRESRERGAHLFSLGSSGSDRQQQDVQKWSKLPRSENWRKPHSP